MEALRGVDHGNILILAMRRVRAIALATVVEVLSEPLVFLVAVSAFALAVFAPVFHYHQFGDPTRMARDAGISSLLVGSMVIGVFGAIVSWRRELESGTAMTVLSHSVSRTAFFLSKTFGVAVACGLFSVAVSLVSLAVVNGCLIADDPSGGASILSRIYGPSLVLVSLTVFMPVILAAVLNRFFRFRFTLSANIIAFVLAVAAACFRFDPALCSRVFPVYMLAAVPAVVFTVFAAAFAIRFRMNLASTLTGIVFLLSLPAIGGYCMADALAEGGSLPSGYVVFAFAAAVPAVAAAAVLGIGFFRGRDLGGENC